VKFLQRLKRRRRILGGDALQRPHYLFAQANLLVQEAGWIEADEHASGKENRAKSALFLNSVAALQQNHDQRRQSFVCPSCKASSFAHLNHLLA